MDTVWTRAGRRLAPVVAVVVLVAAGSAVLVPAPSGAAVIRPAWAAWGQARPAPPSAPRTLPFQPTGALHSAVAGPVSPADLISSSNWSGQVESGGLYSAVSAAWKVPAVGTTNQDEYSGAWIGIDGYGSSTLLQTGTAQESTPSGPQYYAWYEVYPAPAEYLGPVAAGDQMAASISEDSPGTWNLSISDLTSAQGASGPITYDGPASSAEWIAEAPSLGGALTTLAPFGSVTFANLGLTYTGTSFGHTIVMVNLGAESVEAYPQPIDQAADDFTIVQGVPPVPTVTLVTPAVGTTDGGNTVAIGGTGFSTELVVLFGGQPAASVLLDSDTSLVATPPPQLAGPVSVTVETLGGTSAPTGAATYTYSTDPPVIPHGYWLVGADGGIFTFGTAKFHGSTGNLVLNRPVVGITASPDHGGYRLVASDGGLFAFGDSRYYGSIPGLGIGPAGSRGRGARSTPPSWPWCRAPTGPATSWWRPTAGSSPSATPSSPARARRSAGAKGRPWPSCPTLPGTATGWSRRWGRSTPSATPGSWAG